ncbi:MAG: hypothetical protein A2202_03890 [Bdellovibrionales bacterium RIFOXYA1_FULL_36_14]|nr:MAG: hypothetical protein A2202_03890 [Bdellovibrionales bacterium RIFOXYA1_FULL_36_14]
MKRLNMFFLLSLFLSFNIWSFDVPILTGPVVDHAGLLTVRSKQQIEKFIRDIYQRKDVQIQVLTVNDLQGETIESASIQVVEQWGIGSAKEDLGVLLLISKNDRVMRIEVGQGLEGVLPDAVAKRIIADVITPHFRANDYDAGITNGVITIAQYALPNEKIFNSSKGAIQSTSGRPSWLKVLLFILFILFIRTNIFTLLFGSFFGISRFGRRSSGFLGGGSGFGGGGWSGGGGGFSGGGASGRW